MAQLSYDILNWEILDGMVFASNIQGHHSYYSCSNCGKKIKRTPKMDPWCSWNCKFEEFDNNYTPRLVWEH